jgi:hypothetical protein
MTRRKREIVGLTNERDFPHLVELALPPGGFRSIFLEIDAFHRDRRIPVRRGRSRQEAEHSYIRFLLSRPCRCGCIPQSLRWRVLDLRAIEAQAGERTNRSRTRCKACRSSCSTVLVAQHFRFTPGSRRSSGHRFAPLGADCVAKVAEQAL